MNILEMSFAYSPNHATLEPPFSPYLSCVDGVGHDLHPPLEGRHLEEGQVRVAHVVEVDLE